MFTDILWRFLILDAFVLGALCDNRCGIKHPQTWFCTSHFVLKGIFHEIKDLQDADGYMEIKKVFKGDLKKLNIADNGYVRFETLTDVNIRDGRKYIIFGRNRNGRIYSERCSEYLDLFAKDIHYFRNLSKIGCDCMDEIGKYSDDKQCHWYYSYKEKVGKVCKWVKTGDFKLCQNILRY